jgi:hypothetical protein
MSRAESNSTRKFKIELFHKADGSEWIRCVFSNGGRFESRFVPSFHDIHRIVRGIAYCEDRKYPPPQQGRRMVAAFLVDCVDERDYGVLARKYHIPERDGDRVITTNGARLERATPIDLRPGDRFTSDDIPWGTK